MKEATGEANMTVVTIILIAAIVAIATPLISNMMTSSAEKACCQSSGGVWEGTKCSITSSWDAANKKCTSSGK